MTVEGELISLKFFLCPQTDEGLGQLIFSKSDSAQAKVLSLNTKIPLLPEEGMLSCRQGAARAIFSSKLMKLHFLVPPA
jgi:hypothetical protein